MTSPLPTTAARPASIDARGSAAIGWAMHELISRLYPICRSITGDGVRATLRILRDIIPVEIREVPSGTQVFDWTVPLEWNIRTAYVRNSSGKKVIDFEKSNLHILNYSIPVNTRLSLAELRKHCYTRPDRPDWIPYRTSYYERNWGFCISHNQFLALPEDEYEVVVDASLEKGHLTYGEWFLQGETDDEILISVHVCHPSLANDNLSGLAVATFLAKHLSGCSVRYSYRILFLPGLIGPITWLSQNEETVHKVKHGLVLACVGDAGRTTYKKSRRSNADIDKAVVHVLKHSGTDYAVEEFSPIGYDERQFCSPGFNLPVGCFMRTPHGQFPEYHTSADDLDFVKPASLADSFSKCLSIFRILESNRTYLNRMPKCEPQLGKRGLYQMIGGSSDAKSKEGALLWVLNLSDGNHSLLQIAEQSGIPFEAINDAATALLSRGLLRVCPKTSGGITEFSEHEAD
jgi:aminopeptidase-like protein